MRINNMMDDAQITRDNLLKYIEFLSTNLPWEADYQAERTRLVIRFIQHRVDELETDIKRSGNNENLDTP